MSDDPRIPMMREFYAGGLTMQEVGERFGITRQRVHQLLARLDLDLHHGQGKREQRRQEVIEAHERILAGESTVSDEAERLGYASASSLRWRFSHLGLRLRVAPPHGTYARYVSQRYPCRPPCPACAEAAREMRRRKRARGPSRHGTASAYMNYGCHCDECRQAHRDYQRERRQHKREEATQ